MSHEECEKAVSRREEKYKNFEKSRIKLFQKEDLILKSMKSQKQIRYSYISLLTQYFVRGTDGNQISVSCSM